MKKTVQKQRAPSPSHWWVGLLSLNLAASIYASSPDTFQSSVNASGQIYALAQQPDGKILVGGQIYWVDQQPHSGLTRLKPDGTTDPDFHGSAAGPGLGNPYVLARRTPPPAPSRRR